MKKYNDSISFQVGRVALICLLLLALQVRPAFSQLDMEAVSPNAASLGKYIDMPVSYFTGIPNISIPLYEIKEKELTMPISLSYHATAFNPNELPGSVGQNWTLNAGGAIVRKVKGSPDDQFIDCLRMSPHYGLFGFYDAPSKHPELNTLGIDDITPSDPSTGALIDGEPDEYYFNFGGYSGKFMFDNSSDAVVFGNTGLRVEVHPTLYKETASAPTDNGGNESWNIYSISGFRITTPDGYKYEFGKRWDDFSNSMLAVERTEMLFTEMVNYYTTNAWYLVRVLSPSGEQVMTLNYEGGNWVNLYGYNSKYKKNLQLSRTVSYMKAGTQNAAGASLIGSIISSCYLTNISTPNQTVSFTINEANQLLPSYDDINMNMSEHYNQYNYTTKLGLNYKSYNGSRFYDFDKIGSYQVDNVAVFDKATGNQIKSYDFYYTSNPFERLRLLKLQEDSMPPYFFDYNDLKNRFLTGETIEPIPSYENIIEYGNLFVDQWGYYTMNMPMTLLPLLKNPAINDVLKAGPYHQSYFYFIFKKGTELDSILESELMYKPYYTWTGNTNYCLSKIIYPEGGYTTFEYEPHTYTMAVGRDPNTWLPFLKNARNDSTELITGGLRIKSIKHYNREGEAPASSKEYFYEMGILTGIPEYFFNPDCYYNVPPSMYAKFLFGPKIGLYGFTINGAKFYFLQSIIPFSSNGSGSHIGYSKVTEVIDGNGKTEYYYRNFKDHPDLYTPEELQEGKDLHLDDINVQPDDFPCLPSNAIVPLTSFEMERGQLLGTNTYDANDKLLRKERLHYARPADSPVEYLTSDYAVGSTFQYKMMIPETFYIPAIGSPAVKPADVNVYFTYQFNYNIFYYPFNLVSKEVTEYDGNQSIYTETNYDYNYHLTMTDKYCYLRSEEVTANGRKIKKQYFNVLDMLYYYYPYYQPNAADKLCFENMEDRGQIFLPVREDNIEVMPDGSERFLSGTLNRYKLFGNFYKPFETYKLYTNQPIDKAAMNWSWIASDSVNTDNSPYKKDKQFDKYDGQGNLLQWQGEDGLPVSYLWSYNYQYPIAKIENATCDQVKTALGYTDDSQIESLAAQKSPDVDNISNLLRTNLPNAQVTTYTYKPLVGMLTVTDPRGVVTYYDYDDFGRLKETYFYDNNDPNKKRIVKYYDYHYKN